MGSHPRCSDRAVRLNSYSTGTLRDAEPVGEGVFGLKIDVGPGWRIYYGRDGKLVVVLFMPARKNVNQRTSAGSGLWRDYLRRRDDENPVNRRSASVRTPSPLERSGLRRRLPQQIAWRMTRRPSVALRDVAEAHAEFRHLARKTASQQGASFSNAVESAIRIFIACVS